MLCRLWSQARWKQGKVDDDERCSSNHLMLWLKVWGLFKVHYNQIVEGKGTRSKVIVITTDFEVVDNFNPDDAVLSKYFCSMFLRRIVVLSMCKHATALRRQTTQGHGLDLPDYTRSAQICTDLRRPNKICIDLRRRWEEGTVRSIVNVNGAVLSRYFCSMFFRCIVTL